MEILDKDAAVAKTLVSSFKKTHPSSWKVKMAAFYMRDLNPQERSMVLETARKMDVGRKLSHV